jgi:hypothetical protein
MATRDVISFARTEMASIDAQLIKLRAVRSAWETIVTAWEETLAIAETNEVSPPSLFPTPVTASTPVPNPPKMHEKYGDKTGAMRRFVLGVNGAGVSRADLAAKAKTLTSTQNFVYRFIDRMKETGELEERNGRYFATDKMRQKIAEIAA